MSRGEHAGPALATHRDARIATLPRLGREATGAMAVRALTGLDHALVAWLARPNDAVAVRLDPVEHAAAASASSASCR